MLWRTRMWNYAFTTCVLKNERGFVYFFLTYSSFLSSLLWFDIPLVLLGQWLESLDATITCLKIKVWLDMWPWMFDIIPTSEKMPFHPSGEKEAQKEVKCWSCVFMLVSTEVQRGSVDLYFYACFKNTTCTEDFRRENYIWHHCVAYPLITCEVWAMFPFKMGGPLWSVVWILTPACHMCAGCECVLWQSWWFLPSFSPSF